MSFVYWLSKFSQEAILVELFLIACVGTLYFGYRLTKRRRFGVAKKNIPDNIVRGYLLDLMAQLEGFKNQLFGEDFKLQGGAPRAFAPVAETAAPAAAVAAAAGDGAEVGRLKHDLQAAIAKQEELTKAMAALSAAKIDAEARAANATAAGGAAPAAGSDPKKLTEANDKIKKLESKLMEYEVIEDDLANLKRYQQENKQLRAQLEALKGGGAVAAVAAAAPVAAAEAGAPSPIASAEESVSESKAAENFEGFVDKVEASLAPTEAAAPATEQPTSASALDFAAAAAAMTAPPASDSTAAAPAAEAAPAAPAAPAAGEAPAAAPGQEGGAPPKDKSDADLLNEFERMLSS